MKHSLRATSVAILALMLCVATVQAKASTAAVPLNTGQEASVVNGGAQGSFEYTIDGSTLCYTLTWKGLSAPAVAAHIHEAPRGVAGPVVIPLTVTATTTGSYSACISADPGLLADIAANPEDYYVNVHTSTYPGGEIRGQLKQ